jgi:glycosyltransferase involved in cell wall biosynthesis
MPEANILHIAKVTGISGSENHLLMLLAALGRDKYKASFAVLTEPSRPVERFVRALEASGVRARTFPIRRDIDPWCLLELVRFVRRGRFDLVHTHMIHGDLYGTLAAKLAGVRRTVSTKHGYDDYDHTSRLYRLCGLAAWGTDRIVTISHALQDKCSRAEGIPRAKMTTIHYGIDVAAYRAAADTGEDIRAALGLGPEDVVAVSVGRLIPVKGFEYLLEATAMAVREQPGLRVLIAGGGPLEEALRGQVRRLGLERHAYLLGRREDVPRLLAQADLFVLPTLGEGFGLVILEAMVHGLPVVATRTMAIPEIVAHGETGLLVPLRDAAALAQAISSLAADAGLRRRLGEAGRERVAREFTVEAMVARTEALYDRLLAC